MKERIVVWWKTLPKWINICVLVFVGVLLVQFIYPNRSLPFSRVDGRFVWFVDKPEVLEITRPYGESELVVAVRDKITTVKADDIGVSPDVTKVFSGVSDYPWWQRLIPFSLLVKGWFVDQPVYGLVSGEGFLPFSKAREQECFLAPKNASVAVRNGDVVLNPASDGEACSNDSLKKQITEIILQKDSETRLSVKTFVVKPDRSDDDVAPLLDEARKIIKKDLTVVLVGKPYNPETALVATWLAFLEDPKTKNLSVGVDHEKIKEYLASIQKDIYIAPGTTHVTTHDGLEVGRVTGTNGRGIDMDKTAAKVGAALLGSGGEVTAELSVLAPLLRYTRTYSNTPEGLQALINDIVQGKNMAISVRRLGDSGVSANGDKQYHPASTYKLFVAYSVMKRVDSGSISWGGGAVGGQTVAQCFDNMIVNSDNPCAEWFGRTISWGAIDSDAKSIGAARTNLRSENFLSTANDLALFLQKLESNQLGISEASRARLLDAMKRQRHRQGIPAGVGVSVADKVGFLEGKLHDASIVYGPKGVYVLVILSDNSSWSEIASVANQIHAQLIR